MTVSEAVTLIGAVTAGVVSIASAIISLYAAIKTAETHQLVNGVSTRLNESVRSQGNAEGRLAEAKDNLDSERLARQKDNPTAPS